MSISLSAGTLAKVKTDLRISHTALDDDVTDTILACLADLTLCGVQAADTDAVILAAIKLYCRAQYTDDTDKADAYMTRYDALKACLMMASEYGGESDG